MDWTLVNPREGLSDIFITSTIGGKYFLYIKWSWAATSKPVDDYMFTSDSAAKRYYSTNYQSKRFGHEKPKWIKRI